ncbi:unnamed protein product [Mytilus coruscus]|uniref:Uncharacterized protein n=1 Tax=Mytilus coruscus TaxID=42192 RepID=A0A6J8D601_MYTCO|nr:unnamed protein product [Mytilus coruscus]
MGHICKNRLKSATREIEEGNSKASLAQTNIPRTGMAFYGLMRIKGAVSVSIGKVGRSRNTEKKVICTVGRECDFKSGTHRQVKTTTMQTRRSRYESYHARCSQDGFKRSTLKLRIQTLFFHPQTCIVGRSKTTACKNPFWTILAEAASSLEEMVHTGCKKGCRGQCKGFKSALPCTALCKCGGDCA